ncbi:MAG TPA: hypothetical protein VFJ50_09230 [Gemmatimonadales bacterium]|nr:hypothetical protein [Gemmatimonadales bacterium]
MRSELRSLLDNPHVFTDYDLERTVELCRSLALSHWQHTHEPYRDVDLSNQDMIEVLADQNFRTAYDVGFVWQFGLWRLQAVFEALIDQDFLKNVSSQGVWNKLRAMKRAGFDVLDSEEAELRSWTKLRNALSHRPVEPIFLTQQLDADDLREFADLLLGILHRWRARNAEVSAS